MRKQLVLIGALCVIASASLILASTTASAAGWAGVEDYDASQDGTQNITIDISSMSTKSGDEVVIKLGPPESYDGPYNQYDYDLSDGSNFRIYNTATGEFIREAYSTQNDTTGEVTIEFGIQSSDPDVLRLGTPSSPSVSETTRDIPWSIDIGQGQYVTSGTYDLVSETPVTIDVTDTDGNTISGATVEIISGDNTVAKGTTNQSGQFETVVDDGDYTLRAYSRDHEISNKTITVSGTDSASISVTEIARENLTLSPSDEEEIRVSSFNASYVYLDVSGVSVSEEDLLYIAQSPTSTYSYVLDSVASHTFEDYILDYNTSYWKLSAPDSNNNSIEIDSVDVLYSDYNDVNRTMIEVNVTRDGKKLEEGKYVTNIASPPFVASGSMNMELENGTGPAVSTGGFMTVSGNQFIVDIYDTEQGETWTETFTAEAGGTIDEPVTYSMDIGEDEQTTVPADTGGDRGPAVILVGIALFIVGIVMKKW